jgi:transposase-like protein
MPADHTEDLLELRYVMKRHDEEGRWIRLRILELVDAGVSQRTIAHRLGVNTTTLSYWVRSARRERSGTTTPATGAEHDSDSR